MPSPKTGPVYLTEDERAVLEGWTGVRPLAAWRVQRARWTTLNDLHRRTFSWIEEYSNRTRRHSTLGYLTPEEYDQGQ
ncbi:IS3 family transposase [Acidipropionibacterium jensenii]|uniref:IS3 family transposase n=1 Tax=Acidipropionibacterium jensenii TaxID=1749 RepID=UPI00345676AB